MFTRTGSVTTNAYSRPPTTGRPWTARSTNRPNTAQSRPGTGRPQTAASSKREASYVLAILEGRGMGREVGIAALDKDTGRVNLIQVRIGFLSCIYAHILNSQDSSRTSRHMSRPYTRCISIIPRLFWFLIPSFRFQTRLCCLGLSALIRLLCWYRVSSRNSSLFLLSRYCESTGVTLPVNQYFYPHSRTNC